MFIYNTGNTRQVPSRTFRKHKSRAAGKRRKSVNVRRVSSDKTTPTINTPTALKDNPECWDIWSMNKNACNGKLSCFDHGCLVWLTNVCPWIYKYKTNTKYKFWSNVPPKWFHRWSSKKSFITSVHSNLISETTPLLSNMDWTPIFVMN